MLSVVIPYQPCLAAMIGTETILDASRGQEARENINRILQRQDVQAMLRAYGVSPQEAKVRVDTLSDAEVVAFAEHIDNLPAGGNDFGVLVFAVVFVFVILLVTDIMGYTDVFPFVNKTASR
jgi:hypothetical protein